MFPDRDKLVTKKSESICGAVAGSDLHICRDELVVTNTGRLWFLLGDHQHGDIGRQQSVTITITTIFPSQHLLSNMSC